MGDASTGRIRATRFAITPEWLLYTPGVSDRAIRLYAVLRRHADVEGRAHPSRRRLGELLSCSEKSVDRAIAELAALGALVVHPRFTDAGDRTSNDYELADGSPLSTGGVAGDGTCGVTDGATSGVTGDEVEERIAIRNESQIERDSSTVVDLGIPPGEGDPEFEAFWGAFPRRNGKRIGRTEAHRGWRRLSRADRAAALAGVVNYAEACEGGLTIAADAHRWLARRRWSDWETPAVPDARRRPVSSTTSTALAMIERLRAEEGDE